MVTTNRFLIFGGDTFYPDGGMKDFLISFDSLEEVKKYLKGSNVALRRNIDWIHVYDMSLFKPPCINGIIISIDGYEQFKEKQL